MSYMLNRTPFDKGSIIQSTLRETGVIVWLPLNTYAQPSASTDAHLTNMQTHEQLSYPKVHHWSYEHTCSQTYTRKWRTDVHEANTHTHHHSFWLSSYQNPRVANIQCITIKIDILTANLCPYMLSTSKTPLSSPKVALNWLLLATLLTYFLPLIKPSCLSELIIIISAGRHNWVIRWIHKNCIYIYTTLVTTKISHCDVLGRHKGQNDTKLGPA